MHISSKKFLLLPFSLSPSFSLSFSFFFSLELLRDRIQ